MVTVAAPAGADVDVVGAGALGLVVDEYPPPLPLHPHAAKITLATASLRSRMDAHYASPMPAKSRADNAIFRAAVY